MPALSALPAELHHQIGLHIFDLHQVTPRDRLSGYGVFNTLDGQRTANLYSLLAFASTSKDIRAAVEPIAFRSITLRSEEDVRLAVGAEWLPYVKILRLKLDEFEDNGAPGSMSTLGPCVALVRLLDGMTGLQHLYLSLSSLEATALAVVVAQLVPPTPPASPHAGKHGLLKRMRSFALNCSPERHDIRPIFAAVEPLLASFSYLDFLLVMSYNEVERTRSRPRILPLLAHVTAPLRTLNLGGCWQERDDDLLALLPPKLRKVKELFIFHGCDHNNHGQWRENAVARLQTLPNLQVVIWEIEAFWQAVEAQLNPHKEEHYVRQLAGALGNLSVVGFSRYNYFDHMFGIHRYDKHNPHMATDDPKDMSLLPLECYDADTVANFLVSPAVRARELPVLA